MLDAVRVLFEPLESVSVAVRVEVLFESAVEVRVLLEPLESVFVAVRVAVLPDPLESVLVAVRVEVLFEPLESVSVVVRGLELELVFVEVSVEVEVRVAELLLKLVELSVPSVGVVGSAASTIAGAASEREAMTEARISGFIEELLDAKLYAALAGNVRAHRTVGL
jgi:hypothetical protein